jgi:hypothetical protein
MPGGFESFIIDDVCGLLNSHFGRSLFMNELTAVLLCKALQEVCSDAIAQANGMDPDLL